MPFARREVAALEVERDRERDRILANVAARPAVDPGELACAPSVPAVEQHRPAAGVVVQPYGLAQAVRRDVVGEVGEVGAIQFGEQLGDRVDGPRVLRRVVDGRRRGLTPRPLGGGRPVAARPVRRGGSVGRPSMSVGA